MKQITITDKIGALCADDYKGINNQYIGSGKVVVVEDLRGTPIRSVAGVSERRTATGFRRNLWGGYGEYRDGEQGDNNIRCGMARICKEA